MRRPISPESYCESWLPETQERFSSDSSQNRRNTFTFSVKHRCSGFATRILDRRICNPDKHSNAFQFQETLLHFPSNCFQFQETLLHFPSNCFQFQETLLHFPSNCFRFQETLLHFPSNCFRLFPSPFFPYAELRTDRRFFL